MGLVNTWATLHSKFLANFQGTYVKPTDVDDLALIKQKPGESICKFWTRFLKKKNEIDDCDDAEALAACRNNINDDWLSRDFRHYRSKTMATHMVMMTKFCVSEDDWLTKKKGHSDDSGTSEVLSSNKNPRQN